MTRSIQKIYSGELKEIFRHALVTCTPLTAKAMNESLKHTEQYARASAPVYDPAKWVTWWRYSHHYTLPGTLKGTIRRTPVTFTLSGKRFTGYLGAYAPFAGEVEKGFTHHLTGRRVKGTKFMRNSVKFCYEPMFRFKMDFNARRMFKGL